MTPTCVGWVARGARAARSRDNPHSRGVDMKEAGGAGLVDG